MGEEFPSPIQESFDHERMSIGVWTNFTVFRLNHFVITIFLDIKIMILKKYYNSNDT